MINSTSFGKRLQEILDFYGLSATELSKQISVNRSTISHLLSGRNKPSLDFVIKILSKFPEVELYWILNGKGTFPSEKNSNETSASPSSFLKTEEKSSLNVNSKIKKKEIFMDTSKISEKKEIDKIVIFFKDGSFKSYEN